MSDNAKIYEHESYGLVQFSRRQGNPRLFGSALDNHQQYVTLSVRRAELIREGTHDRYHGSIRGDLIEVDMSSAQFAELLTTMNVGMGVPCTVTYLNGTQMAPPPDLASLTDNIRSNFREEMEKLAVEVREGLGAVREVLNKKSLTNADRVTILKYVERVARQFDDHAPFAMDMFREATEQLVTAAKTEADAWMTGVITQAGVAALQAAATPQLEGKKE